MRQIGIRRYICGRNIIIVCVMLFATASQAAEGIVLNGFASFYGRQSLTDIYDTGNNGYDLDFSNNTRVGLNMRSELSNDFAFVGQIVAAQRLTYESPKWATEFDWMFLNYSLRDDVTIRFGRQLNPGSIIGEYIDIGLTYPWRRLPLPFQFMVQFKSFEGLSANYSKEIGRYALDILGYGGNSRPFESNVPHYSYEIKDLQGIRIKLEGENWQIFTVGADFKYFGYQPSFTFGVPPSKVDSGASSRLTNLGGHFDNGKILVYTEYSNLECAGTGDPVCSGWAHYETIGYHFSNWLPHYTYSKGFFQEVVPFAPASVSGPNNMVSHTAGLNYQVNPSLVAKTEFIWQENDGGTGTLFMNGAGIARSYSFGVDLVF